MVYASSSEIDWRLENLFLLEDIKFLKKNSFFVEKYLTVNIAEAQKHHDLI